MASASAPMPGRSAARRARTAGSAMRYTFTSAPGATTVPMSRPSMTTFPSWPSSRWRSRITSRTSWWRATTGRAVDAGLADRRVTSRAVDLDAAVVVERRPGARARARPSASPCRAGGRAAREPRERAVHRARVEVAEAEPLGEPPRNLLLPAPAGPSMATIIGRPSDVHRSSRATRSSSKKPGKLTATASASSIRRPRGR